MMEKTYLLFVLKSGSAELHFHGTISHIVVDQVEPWDSIASIAKILLKNGEEISKIELLSERWRQHDKKTYKVTTHSIGEERTPLLEAMATTSSA